LLIFSINTCYTQSICSCFEPKRHTLFGQSRNYDIKTWASRSKNFRPRISERRCQTCKPRTPILLLRTTMAISAQPVKTRQIVTFSPANRRLSYSVNYSYVPNLPPKPFNHRKFHPAQLPTTPQLQLVYAQIVIIAKPAPSLKQTSLNCTAKSLPPRIKSPCIVADLSPLILAFHRPRPKTLPRLSRRRLPIQSPLQK
jgi:hypothetical protein